MVTELSSHRWSGACAALTLALALGCWPTRPGRGRLAAVLSAGPGRSVPRLGGRMFGGRPFGGARVDLAVLAGSGLIGWFAAGPGGLLAAAMACYLGFRRWRGARLGRRRGNDVAALVDAIGLMVAELRAGAHPATAASAASVGTGPVHRVLASVAAGARLGAEVPALLTRYAGAEPAIGAELSRLASAWALAERHGVALAELIDAVRADLDARVRLAGQVRAQLAGPRATASVLAGLPLLGVALGEGVGADPWHVLSGTATGQVLLVIGTGLACAGTMWSGRIMARAVPR